MCIYIYIYIIWLKGCKVATMFLPPREQTPEAKIGGAPDSLKTIVSFYVILDFSTCFL